MIRLHLVQAQQKQKFQLSMVVSQLRNRKCWIHVELESGTISGSGSGDLQLEDVLMAQLVNY